MEADKNLPTIDDEEKEIEQKMIKIISLMPAGVQNRFKVLKVLSDKRSKLSDQFEAEIKALDAQIAAKKKPLYDQRKQIVSGETKDFSQYLPTFDATHKKLEEECALIVTKKADDKKKEGDNKDEEEEEFKKVDVENLKGVDGIPDFWFRSMKNNQMIWELVKEKDEEILKHVRQIESEKTDEPKTLTVTFLFNQNEFFSNTELKLKVFYKGDNDEVEKIEGTEIQWAEGKDPTKKKIKKKQKNKKTNETRTIVKTVEAESFFNVFTNRAAPAEDAALESEEENELLDKLDQAMNLAEDIHDVLIPDALEYYLGLNDDLYDPDMMGDDEDDSDPEGDGSGDDSDDGNKKKKGGKAGKGADKPKGGAGSAEDQKECKQQ